MRPHELAIMFELLPVYEIGPYEFHREVVKAWMVHVGIQHDIRIDIAAFRKLMLFHKRQQNKPSLKTKQVVLKGHKMNMFIDSRHFDSGMHVLVYHLVNDAVRSIPPVSSIPYQIDGRIWVAYFRLLQAVCEIIIVPAMDDHNRQGHTLSASFYSPYFM